MAQSSVYNKSSTTLTFYSVVSKTRNRNGILEIMQIPLRFCIGETGARQNTVVLVHNNIFLNAQQVVQLITMHPLTA